MSDPFVRTRAQFQLPDGIVYLDGNSLGPLPIAAKLRLAREIDAEWGEQADPRLERGRLDRLARRVGDRSAA